MNGVLPATPSTRRSARPGSWSSASQTRRTVCTAAWLCFLHGPLPGPVQMPVHSPDPACWSVARLSLTSPRFRPQYPGLASWERRRPGGSSSSSGKARCRNTVEVGSKSNTCHDSPSASRVTTAGWPKTSFAPHPSSSSQGPNSSQSASSTAPTMRETEAGAGRRRRPPSAASRRRCWRVRSPNSLMPMARWVAKNSTRKRTTSTPW